LPTILTYPLTRSLASAQQCLFVFLGLLYGYPKT
jgi:hypothetical protein